jgi:GntR family transcriptional regulator
MPMFVDKNSPIPAYYQLRGIILDKVHSGEYPAGSLIPSERDLSQNLGISRMTVRQALNQLVLEGVLTREKGKGTYVSRIKLEQKNIMSFSEAVRLKGMTPGARILHFGKTKATDGVREALGLREGENIYLLKRLRLANDMPVGIEEDFISEKFCPQLERFDLTASLYRIFKEAYRHDIVHVDNVIEASRPSKEETKLLEITLYTPVLRVTSVNYTQAGIRLFHERSAYRSDEYKYSMRIYVNKRME